MEELGEFISSFNKISLVVFFITLGFLAYEIYLFRKEGAKKDKPKIPDFKEGIFQKTVKASPILVKTETKKIIKRPSKISFIIGLIILLVIIANAIINFYSFEKNTEKNNQPESNPVVNIVASKGIILYDNNWIPITESNFTKIKRGSTIYIGIDSTKDANIDMARIRVNEKEWSPDKISLIRNDDKGIFYKEYQIASEESVLNIEAQLHSKIDGWLGD